MGYWSNLRTSSMRKPPLARCNAPGPDQVEVRDQGAHLRDVLDPSNQVLKAGMVLEDDRCLLQFAVVHQQVDLVGPAQRRSGKHARYRRNFLGLQLLLSLDKGLGVLDEVFLHAVQKVNGFLDRGIFLLKLP